MCRDEKVKARVERAAERLKRGRATKADMLLFALLERGALDRMEAVDVAGHRFWSCVFDLRRDGIGITTLRDGNQTAYVLDAEVIEALHRR